MRVHSVLESSVEGDTVDYAEDLGWVSIKLNGQGNIGKPDRVFLNEGRRIIFVEFKKTGEGPRKLQQWWRELLVKMGFAHYIIDTASDGKLLFDRETRKWMTKK